MTAHLTADDIQNMVEDVVSEIHESSIGGQLSATGLFLAAQLAVKATLKPLIAAGVIVVAERTALPPMVSRKQQQSFLQGFREGVLPDE